MTLRIRISPQATDDLTQIWNTIANGSPRAADKFIDKIFNVIDLLARFPNSGIKKEEHGKGMRTRLHGKYIIYYRAHVDVLEVFRVVHAARDMDLLFPNNN